MKRWTIRILVFLLLGVIVNVAVAWGCAVCVDINQAPPIRGRLGSPQAPRWFVTCRQAFGSLQIHRHVFIRKDMKGLWEPTLEMYGADVTDMIPSWSDAERDFTSWSELDIEEARGWPAFCVRCAWDQHTIRWRNNLQVIPVQSFRVEGDVVHFVYAGKEFTFPLRGNGVVGGWLLDVTSGGRDIPAVRVVPYQPIWPGFAINTLFYAGILWLLFAAPFALRRRRRIKRGLCPACAYPVGASDVCTECGKPVR
jgi:hypothetical protein